MTNTLVLPFLGIFFTYVLTPLILFLGIARFLNFEKKDRFLFFALLLGLAPIVTSWLLRWLLFIIPNQQDFFYISSIIGFYLCIFLFSYKKSYLYADVWHECTLFYTKQDITFKITSALAGFVTIAILSIYAWLAIRIPIMANDPSQYATVARFFYEYKAIDIYPFIQPDPNTGFYAPSSHPIAFPSLMTWSYMLQGTSEHTFLLRFISPYFAFTTCLALFAVLYKRNKNIAMIGALILVTTPLYMFVVRISHIDPLRIYTFFMAIVWLAVSLAKKNVRFAVIAGIFTGFSLFSHSIGILSLPFAIAIVSIFPDIRIRLKIIFLITIIITSCVVGGARYLTNYIDKGAILSDSAVVLELPEIDYKEYVRHDRGLDTIQKRFQYGLLKAFSKTDQFGLTYWFLAGTILIFFVTKRKTLIKKSQKMLHDPYFFSMATSFLFFYGLIFATFCIGSDSFIKNSRYLLTIQPVIAFVSAYLLGIINEE